MIISLHIQNYALIDRLDIDFERGFSVITGETGAGKSIILGAIGLLLGQRADSKSIKVGAAKCIIEAHFDLTSYNMEGFFEENDLEYDNECILRRELSASGKSRSFINDVPAQLSQMKELGEQLIDVHSQHQNLLLNKESFQLNVVDILANNAQEVKAYKEAYHHWRSLSAELAHLTEEAEKSRADVEAEWIETQASASCAAECGEIDDVVAPAELRQRICAAVYMLAECAEDAPTRKHGVMPL